MAAAVLGDSAHLHHQAAAGVGLEVPASLRKVATGTVDRLTEELMGRGYKRGRACQCCRARAMTKLFTARQLGRIRSWADSSRRAVAAAEEQEQDTTAAWPTAEQMRRAKQAPLSADAHSEEVLAPETVGPPQPPRTASRVCMPHR